MQDGFRRAGAYIKGTELCVGILVANTAFEGAHGLFRSHRLGADHV